MAMDPQISIPQKRLADALGIDRKTLCHILRNHNIDYEYDELTDTELDRLVKQFKQEHPESGI
jgi:hypothetical protein